MKALLKPLSAFKACNLLLVEVKKTSFCKDNHLRTVTPQAGESCWPSHPTHTPLQSWGGASTGPFIRECEGLLSLAGTHPMRELSCVPGETKAQSLGGNGPCSTECCSGLIPLLRSLCLPELKSDKAQGHLVVQNTVQKSWISCLESFYTDLRCPLLCPRRHPRCTTTPQLLLFFSASLLLCFPFPSSGFFHLSPHLPANASAVGPH